MNNPYTCRLLIRLDRAIYLMRGRLYKWDENTGKLYHGNSYAKSHFPGWMFRLAAHVQNRFPWTRKVLSK